ncbi:hypothetical protein [Guptibacillus hwajinpoensis]
MKRLRDAVKALSEEDLEEFISITRITLRKQFNKDLKPSYIKARLYDFLDGKDTSLVFLECYLQSLDAIHYKGALTALKRGEAKTSKTWRELMITITNDVALPIHIQKHLEDDQTSYELKILFKTIINYCEHIELDNFQDNLRITHRFLSIGKVNGR